MKNNPIKTEWFTPPQLAELFGVNVSTIKRWADKNFLPARITAGGHRRITREQLNAFIDKHPKHAKNSYVLKRLRKKDYCPPANCWKKYYDYLLKNENDQAASIVERLYLSGTNLLNIYKKVIYPTLNEISGQWSKNNISVYEEHRMGFNIRAHLIKLGYLIPDRSNKNSPSAILTCAPGEYYELPLQLLALLFKLFGWQTHILGINISLNELLQAAKKIKPKVMMVTKTYTTNDLTAFCKKLTSYAEQHGICLAFGGGAWKKEFKKPKNQCWATKKCVRYFPNFKEFCEHLSKYKRKK